MADPRILTPAELSVPVLRAERNVARRALEIELLRGRGTDDDAVARLGPLRDRVRFLTDELISRYSRDLSLVDSLLESPYPARARRTADGGPMRPEVTS